MSLPDYRSMYFSLAAQVAEAIDLLVAAQQQAEEAYLEGCEEEADDEGAQSL